tara:strand:- start:427 stop:1392 length:966 start_codon:yes stop_codon:yes gene_type:complete
MKKTSKSSIRKIITSVNKTKKRLKDIKNFKNPSTSSVYNIEDNKSKVIQLLKKNIITNKKINPSKFIPPRQSCTNCWFNVLFLVNFISDRGKKMSQDLRLDMINENYDKSLVKKTKLSKFKYAMFLFNLAIESCSSGSSFAKVLNTNEILIDIHDSIKYPSNWVKKKGDYGNALEYFDNLLKFIYPNNAYTILSTNHNIFNSNNIYLKKLPEIITVEIFDTTSRYFTKKKNTLIINYNNETIKYVLDSICIRDINKEHVGCFITLNDKGYFFDGDSNIRITQVKWNSNSFLNSNKNISFGNKYATFNLKNGYQILYFFKIN